MRQRRRHVEARIGAALRLPVEPAVLMRQIGLRAGGGERLGQRVLGPVLAVADQEIAGKAHGGKVWAGPDRVEAVHADSTLSRNRSTSRAASSSS